MAAKALLVAHKMNFNQCHFKENALFSLNVKFNS
jgi:hypothetical protein